MTTTHDVMIVGAGPAGSALAILLAQRGIHSVIIDRSRFPRVKPCGETLNPGVVRLLGELDVLSRVMACNPASIAGWKLIAGLGNAIGWYAKGQFGLGMPRRDLDAILLHDAEKRGAMVVQGMHVFGITRRKTAGFDVDCRREDGQPTRMRTRYIVGADGLRSIVSRRLDLVGRPARRRKFSVTCRLRGIAPRPLGVLHIGNGYTVGLAPVHETAPLWNGTVVLPSHVWRNDCQTVKQAYESRLFAVLGARGERAEVVDGPWTSGPFDRPVRSVATRDALLIGDAAGYFDPLTGQGVFQALRTAQLAADAFERCCQKGESQSSVFAAYARRVVREHRWTRAFQHGVEAVLSREKLRNVALHRLSKSARYMDRLVQFAGDALPVRGLMRVDLLARVEEVV